MNDVRWMRGGRGGGREVDVGGEVALNPGFPFQILSRSFGENPGTQAFR